MTSETKTRVCHTCKETKPLNQFNRRLTLAQSRAYLRNPKIQTRYTTISKNCSDCRRVNRRRKPLTANEIRNKITSGDLHPMIGEAMLKELREAIPKRRSRVMKEYWQKKRGDAIAQAKKNIQQQVAKYANRYHAYKAGKPTTPAQHAMLEQHRYNYEEAKRVRDELLEQIRLGTNVPVDVKLYELFKTKRKVVSNEVL